MNKKSLALIGASSVNPLGYNRSYKGLVLDSLVLFPLLKLGFVLHQIFDACTVKQ
ncbi:hypothetical protein HanPSC8_Chr10g0423101 [Helianthus annuus]|nr:hypothetical protein HanPSC8_Chr10g0423101 [Helianthus annuus]